ncbi:MAG: glycosyltransferase family 2 protein, partial [Vicinamibacterales bacterium]
MWLGITSLREFSPDQTFACRPKTFLSALPAVSARPRVSVVMPSFNSCRFLTAAVESVLNQDYENWELRIVDDGSTDGSDIVAREFAERFRSQITVHHHPHHQNRGAAASRNVGLQASRTELVTFLDADDVWLPDALRRQVLLLDKFPDAQIGLGATQYWYSWKPAAGGDARDVVPALGFEPETVVPPPTLATINYPLGTAPAPSMNALIARREALEAIGGFESSFSGISGMYEDQALLIKIYLHCAVVAGRHVCDRYRQHDRSICARVTEAGGYDAVRAHFLTWLAGYIDAS